MIDSRQLHQWLEAFRDGTLAEAEANQLARRLSEDPETLSRFCQDLAFTNLLGHLTDDILCADSFSRAFWERVKAEDATEEFTRHFRRRRTETQGTSESAGAPELWEVIQQEQEVKRRAEEALDQFKAEERRRAEEQAYKAYLAKRRQFTIGAGALIILLAISLFAWLAPKPEAPESMTEPPAPITPSPVATILKSVDGQWDRSDYSIVAGTRLTASSVVLQQGLIEIRFDAGAKVILQAPCVLRLNDTDSMYLARGIISVYVPERASGFRVETPAGIVTDYGTEFGVIAHENGETETHVYKGRVGLESNRHASSSGHTEMLTEGQAGTIEAAGTIKRTPFNLTRFVYSLEQPTRFGIPGKRLNLADIVGGGNGFGTGTLEHGINPLNGRPYTDMIQTLGLSTHQGTTHYWPVSANPFVDGVFTPDNEDGQVQVSTEGHVFAGFPDTSGAFYGGIMNGSFHESVSGASRVPKTYLRLSGKDYGIENPSIYLHSNKGITFDLQAIRTAMPGVVIQRFTALCGTSESLRMFTDSHEKTDYWVLVDGRKVYEQRGITVNSPPQPLRIDLRPEDRFLTLAVTDGGDGVGNDWAMFSEPALELTTTGAP